MTRGLLDERATAQLRDALADYTVDAVHERIGLAGQAALGRADLRGVARQFAGDDPLATFLRLFLLGDEVSEKAAGAAFAPLPLDTACGAGLLERSGSAVRALLDIRPYAEQVGPPHDRGRDEADWWVVSDFGAEVRGGPLAPEHVLGIGAASLTLAQATPRAPVGRALDVGIGCGIQALHLAGHSGRVTATDISDRALTLAATTAALSGQAWDLRPGSLLEPVAGEQFDLVVANPPFVVSSGTGGYDYRDSGRPGDGISEALIREVPDILAPGGTAQLLANWVISRDEEWGERLQRWLAGSGCDAWIWQREVADPGEYVSLWLRDAGERPGTPTWDQRYDAWLDWFVQAGVAAVGMGLVTMWRSGAADPVVVCEDVRQPVEQPVGPQLPAWISRQRWLQRCRDAELLAAVLQTADGLVLDRSALLGGQGWQDATAYLRQSHGLRWSVEVDAAIVALVAGCDGTRALSGLVAVLAAALGEPADAVESAVLPVVRDLVGRGFLLPRDAS